MVWKKFSQDGKKVLRAVDAQVVDQDVGVGQRRDQRLAAGCRGQVGGNALGLQAVGLQGRHGGVQAPGIAGAQGHTGTGLGQSARNGQANARAGAGDEDGFSGKIDVHVKWP